MFEQIQKIVRETQSISLPHYGNVPFTCKDDTSYLTELDVAVEKQLREKLALIDPSIGFFGEETGGDRNAERFWLCDPIDGTNPYVRGFPFCTTMIALVESGEVTMSFIYDFVMDELYCAKKGEGAFCNGKKISVSDRPVDQSYIFWESHNKKLAGILLEKYAGLPKFMAAGSELIAVASGKAEARITVDGFGTYYDYAPGALLVQEAGGIVRNLGSDRYDYENFDFIAATPQIIETLEKDVAIAQQ